MLLLALALPLAAQNLAEFEKSVTEHTLGNGMRFLIVERRAVPVVSLSDFTFLVEKKTTVEEVNQAIKDAAEQVRFKNVLAWTDEPLVSSDFVKNPYSAIADLGLTKVIGGDFVKVVAWYDNEWGYSMRLAEMVEQIGKTLK